MKKGEQKIEKTEKKKVFKSKITILFIAIIVVAIIVVALLFIFNKNNSNINYDNDMISYGFDKLYNNETTKSNETVSKSESLKMIIGVALNRNNIDELVDLTSILPDYDGISDYEDKLEYDNQIWVEYAKSFEMISSSEITKVNQNEKATLIDALTYLSKAKAKLLNKTLDTDVEVKVKNLESFKADQQFAIKDMIKNEIIENKDYNWRQTLTKQELNKLVINFALKYNTLTLEDEKVNINKAKEPKNIADYPYTLANINKEVYEIENYISDADEYNNAKLTYGKIKEKYNTLKYCAEQYLNTILNIDYTTTDEAKLKESLTDATLDLVTSEDISAYVAYVKENNIKITGTAKAQMPAIYFDGELYRVRVKIEYTVTSNKMENVLLGDLGTDNTFKYDSTKKESIIDLPLNVVEEYGMFYVVKTPIQNITAGSVK
ncbi:MAG: hypothetical protein PHP54_03430 [Clostridia bacterium]|nr:hypothetical protein [Clostridia bacterium]